MSRIRQVVKDVTANRYFKSNPGGWEGKWLKAEKIVWAYSPHNAAKYSESERDWKAIKGVKHDLSKLFPSHTFVIETYETTWIKVGEE